EDVGSSAVKKQRSGPASETLHRSGHQPANGLRQSVDNDPKLTDSTSVMAGGNGFHRPPGACWAKRRRVLGQWDEMVQYNNQQSRPPQGNNHYLPPATWSR